VTDVNVARVQEATAKFDATAVELETIVMVKYDVLSPNTVGAILDDDTIPRLHAPIIAGAAPSRPDVIAAV
jgi:leucine dehydrogenase